MVVGEGSQTRGGQSEILLYRLQMFFSRNVMLKQDVCVMVLRGRSICHSPVSTTPPITFNRVKGQREKEYMSIRVRMNVFLLFQETYFSVQCKLKIFDKGSSGETDGYIHS